VSRITQAFATARKSRRAALVAYVTAGDPNLSRTVELASALRRGGADVLELGVPFSEPIADGPTNQRAAERALASGTTLAGVLDTVRLIRAAEEIPIVLFTYANPVVQYGVERFAEDAADAGVDGVLFTDVPNEEMDRFRPALERSGLDAVLLVTPTSTRARVKVAGRAGEGFLYLVSRTGVTGARTQLEPELTRQIKLTRKLARVPVVVGFGIATPAQVAELAKVSDGVVVGSAIVDRVARVGDSDELGDTIQRFVTPLAEACRRG
jgi:tryptophan synthase alpha chain